MGLFTKTKISVQQKDQAGTIASARTLNLNFHQHRSETISSMAAATLASGGFEPPRPKDPEVGDNAVPCIGDRMPDGTVYAGISPDTAKPMYVMPADASPSMKWKEAVNYARKLDAHGHQDWRLPTKGELAVLFNNRAQIGGFNLSGAHPEGWYWSASWDKIWGAWCQDFSDGYQNYNGKDPRAAVRCVRYRRSS